MTLGSAATHHTSGITVHTSGDNAAALSLYESCGPRAVEHTSAIVGPAPSA
ncbi:MAG: hypothetical protein M3510_08905 [Actinomycetota bacterium]|nr:hypothetical protein [Actinomycetota bacterium]